MASPVLISVPDHRRGAAVVNNVLIGSTPGLAVQTGTEALAAPAPVGVITGAGAAAGHLAAASDPARGAAASVSSTASR
jgi:hypothetical protein